MKQFETEQELRDFDGKPFEFELRGRVFKAKPSMPPEEFGAFVALMQDIGNGELRGNPFIPLEAALRNSLYKEFREEWDALLREDFDIPIQFNTLVMIGQAILENAADRPTLQPQPSGSSQANGAANLTEGSVTRVAAASTLSRSTPDST